MYLKTRLILSLLIVAISYSDGMSQDLVDKKATKKTKALYQNLKRISEQGFLFGHQDDDAYGMGWNEVEGGSDVKSVSGSYPAVHGWDLGKIELNRKANLDNVNFDKMRNWIKQTYKRGGVNTISWHVDNPVTKGSSWDKTPAVKDILPGGQLHSYYVDQLDLLAAFLKSCKSGSTKIPIIFRPYHEHNGDWFWWGKGNCSEEEYKELWQFTVKYLRDTGRVHNLLYVFSPDRSRWNLDSAASDYFYGYPGDDYVDILGVDNYKDVGPAIFSEVQRNDLIKGLSTVSQLALEKNKVAVLSETGQETLKNPNWFTEVILNPIKENDDIKIAYVMVWRNAFNRENHFYAPYPGHPSENDFKVFYNDDKVLFESEVQNMYKQEKPLTKK